MIESEVNKNTVDDALSIGGGIDAMNDAAVDSIAIDDKRQEYAELFNNRTFREFLKEIIDETGYGTREVQADNKLAIRTGEKNIGASIVDRILLYAPGYLEAIINQRVRPVKAAN